MSARPVIAQATPEFSSDTPLEHADAALHARKAIGLSLYVLNVLGVGLCAVVLIIQLAGKVAA